MATRDEVMTAADRLVKRGELGEAARLLDMWTRANPDDAAAAAKLQTVRGLADPEPERPRVSARAEAPLLSGALPARRPSEPSGWPADPVERLQLLLQRVQQNRRTG
jgi:hypothetical protein